MLLFLFSSSAARLQTQSSSSFHWESPLLNLWWVRKYFYLPRCAPGTRGAEEEKHFCLSVSGTDLICSHQAIRYSFGGDFPLWLPPWQAGIPQQELSYSLGQLPVGFIANRSKTFLFRLRFVHFQSAAEYTIHHAPNPGLAVSLLARSPSSVGPCLLAGCIAYMQKDIADALLKAACNTKC